MFSILFINSFGLDVVKEIECQNEEECKIQFENYLQEQKRIFAIKEYPNPHLEKRKSNLNELQSTIQSSDKEKTKEENLYFNIDSTSAPGFGMVIPSPEDVKLQQNSKMKAKIYAASKAEEEHTEFVLIKHFIFDLLSFNDEAKQRTDLPHKYKNEDTNLKNIGGVIFIYVNDSPCASCTERYIKLIKQTSIKFYVYYSNNFALSNIPKKKGEFKILGEADTYKNCVLEIKNRSNSKRSMSQMKDSKSSQKGFSASEEREICDCINNKVELLRKYTNGQIIYKQINLNEHYKYRIQVIKYLLSLNP